MHAQQQQKSLTYSMIIGLKEPDKRSLRVLAFVKLLMHIQIASDISLHSHINRTKEINENLYCTHEPN